MLRPVCSDQLSLPQPGHLAGCSSRSNIITSPTHVLPLTCVLPLAPGRSGSVALAACLRVQIITPSGSLAQTSVENMKDDHKSHHKSHHSTLTCADCWGPSPRTLTGPVFWPTPRNHCRPRRLPPRPPPPCAGHCRTAPSCSRKPAQTPPAGTGLGPQT